MVMETWKTRAPYSVVSEFEGTLLKSDDTFSYFMLLAFDASGLIRFAVLLFLWPFIKLLDIFSFKNAALKLMIFVATIGLREREIESAARAVLPKFYMDDLSMETWRVFSSCKKRVVVTRMPRVMVERFAIEHLIADEIIGTELIVNRFGFVTGLIRETDINQSIMSHVANLFVERRPHLGLGKPVLPASTTFLSLCEIHAPVPTNDDQQLELQPPKPVIFHDGRLVKRPTPAMALLILLWIPFGVLIAIIRIFGGYILPMWAIPYVIGMSGFKVTIKGKPPPQNSGGFIFVCNHKTMLDEIVIAYALQRSIPVVMIHTHSRLYDILSPVPIVRFTRIHDVDALKMKQELSKGDLVMCPEGVTCSQPMLFRFSALFAELTNKIVPVAINCKLQFFQRRGRSWSGLDLIFLFMDPITVYEVTFLNQLPIEDTCFSGKSSHEVANHVQRILADTLGFECTNFRRKDKMNYLLNKETVPFETTN